MCYEKKLSGCAAIVTDWAGSGAAWQASARELGVTMSTTERGTRLARGAKPAAPREPSAACAARKVSQHGRIAANGRQQAPQNAEGKPRLPIQQANVLLTLETRDRDHCDTLIALLRERGYIVREDESPCGPDNTAH